MAYEYRYRFSIDEEIFTNYGPFWKSTKYIFDTRTNFIAKGRSDGDGDGEEERTIDSERYVFHVSSGKRERGFRLLLRLYVGIRFMDYLMPEEEIHRLIDQLLLFATAAAENRPGQIPVAVDLDVCTVQRDGEAIASTMERSIRPDVLPPLYLYPAISLTMNPRKRPAGYVPVTMFTMFSMYDFVRRFPVIRVDGEQDVAKAAAVMEVCGVCGGKARVGTWIWPLVCGHAYHYHCIVTSLLTVSNSCPTCCHRPVFDESFYINMRY